MKLPKSFTDRLKKERPQDAEEIIDAFKNKGFQGLRVNTLKISVADFLAIFPFQLEPVPWTKDGFYYQEHDPVTKHPFYHAGLYYIQEPSAMSPVATHMPKAGDHCVDLCAAPGGKSLQMATAIQDKGLLISNDISDKRVKAIVRNVERFGLRNVIVLNETPENIADHFGNCFDYVLVDAPCSGEGMFRRDEKAVQAWETYDNVACAEMQHDILESVPHLLKQSGKMTYATCTFANEENEGQISRFMSKHKSFIEDAIENDHQEYITGIEYNGAYLRLWPHKIKGEGHFVARLIREKSEDSGLSNGDIHLISDKHLPKGVSSAAPEAIETFMAEHLKSPLTGYFKTVKDKVYLLPEHAYDLTGLKIAREGVLLGEIKKNRFTPAQALALYLKADQFLQTIDLHPESKEVEKYLKCETLHVDSKGQGIHLVTTAGYPLGFCKISQGTLKNMYPASWRLI